MQIQLSRTKQLTLCLFVLSLLAACSSEPPAEKNEKHTQARPAKILTVGHTENNDFLNYPAVIQYQQSSVLSFEVGGMVEKLAVVEAQQVNKGDLLAQLNQRDLQAKLTSARAQYKNAQAKYQRATRLMKEDAISQNDLEERKTQRNVSKSQLDTAEKALQDSVLIAPYSGIIAKVVIEKRQLVQPGKPAITILGKKGLEATINLPSDIIAKAKQQPEPNETYIILDAAPDRRIPANFQEVSLEADPASQTYAVTFAFTNPEDLIILPGMNAVVWIEDPAKASPEKNKIRIPLTAITENGEQKYVWVVDSTSMTVSKRNIVLEAGVGTTLGVISGLESGEMIIAAGVSALSEGMKVSPWSK